MIDKSSIHLSDGGSGGGGGGSAPAAAPEKLTIRDLVEDFSNKTSEQAEAKKVLIRNLKAFVHKVVRVSLSVEKLGHQTFAYTGPGTVAARRVGDKDWEYPADKYICYYHPDGYPALVGMVIGYELTEREGDASAYLIVAAPGDRFERRFDIAFSDVEVLDGASLSIPDPEPDSREEIMRIHLSEFGLRPQIRNPLIRVGINTVGSVAARTTGELLAVPGFGKKRLQELTEHLDAYGLRLPG